MLAAVVDQIDDEMDKRLQAISGSAKDPWAGFCRRCQAYLEMALEPEFQRIVDDADPEALAALIYGSLAEAAFWIAEGEDSDKRLEQGITALNLLLRGLRRASSES